MKPSSYLDFIVVVVMYIGVAPASTRLPEVLPAVAVDDDDDVAVVHFHLNIEQYCKN